MICHARIDNAISVNRKLASLFIKPQSPWMDDIVHAGWITSRKNGISCFFLNLFLFSESSKEQAIVPATISAPCFPMALLNIIALIAPGPLQAIIISKHEGMINYGWPVRRHAAFGWTGGMGQSSPQAMARMNSTSCGLTTPSLCMISAHKVRNSLRMWKLARAI